MTLPSDDVSVDDALINQRLITTSNLMKNGTSGAKRSILMPNLVTSANGLHDIK